MLMKGLTEKQQTILSFLRNYFAQHNYWPSIREIQSEFGFKSTNAVVGHLRALERKGELERISGQARTYKLKNMPTVAPETGVPAPASMPSDGMPVSEIPLYGEIAAGYPGGVETADAAETVQLDAYTASRLGQGAFALRVQGDSMIDAEICEGDVVILEPKEPRHLDIVAALIDGETTLKRYIQPTRQDAPYLKAENKAYPQFYPLDSLQVQGVARAVVRSLH